MLPMDQSATKDVTQVPNMLMITNGIIQRYRGIEFKDDGREEDTDDEDYNSDCSSYVSDNSTSDDYATNSASCWYDYHEWSSNSDNDDNEGDSDGDGDGNDVVKHYTRQHANSIFNDYYNKTKFGKFLGCWIQDWWIVTEVTPGAVDMFKDVLFAHLIDKLL